jgi:hypothetical protein
VLNIQSTSDSAVIVFNTRRRRLVNGIIEGAVIIFACRAWRNARADIDLDDARARVQRGREIEAQKVQRLYSTKVVRVRLGSEAYAIPVNYFSPKGAEIADRIDTKSIGFVLFLPDFSGYTKENWRDRFDVNRIDVVTIRRLESGDKINVGPGRDEPDYVTNYGDPVGGFKNLRHLYEEKPSFSLYGLEGYRPKNGTHAVLWTGVRSNGEFFFFTATVAPDSVPGPGELNPLCDVRYYSNREKLFVAYTYSQTYLPQWREIDDAIWRRLNEWRVK